MRWSNTNWVESEMTRTTSLSTRAGSASEASVLEYVLSSSVKIRLDNLWRGLKIVDVVHCISYDRR